MKSYRNILSKKTAGTLFEVICILLALFLVGIRVYYLFSYSTNLEGVEFALVHFIQLICLKGSLYTNAAKFPYLLVVHAPLYYYSMAAIMKLFSVNVVNDIHTIYIIGRSIAFLLLFVNYFILLKIVQLFIVHFKYKIRLFLLFILFIPAHFYACRPDAFKVLFFMLFLYNSIQLFKTGKNSYAILAFLSLFISILFKQDVLVYGCLLYIIFFTQTRKIIYIISPILLVVSIVGCMSIYYLFSGINLFKELFVYNIQYNGDLTINLLLISCHYAKALPLLIFSVLNLKSKNKITVTLSILSLLYFFIFTLLMLRTGSSLNYTYESVILMLLNTFIYIDEKQFNRSLTEAIVYIFILFSINEYAFYKFTYAFHNYYLQEKKEINYKESYYNNLATSKKIKQIIGNHVVFIPDMKYYLFYAESRIIYGADWHYDRYCAIALNIKIDPKFIRNNIVEKYDRQFANGNVEYILIEDNYKSKNLLKKYYTSFVFQQQVNNFLIYKFNKQ
ncbi:MAG TPA: hypothetical protein PK431_03460 [Chitinophagales bacterium]|nr:hypothetical protein [Chitinophagales bacterium]